MMLLAGLRKRAHGASRRFCSSFKQNLKITRVTVYQVDLPLHEGVYRWSGGKSVDVFDATVVRVEANNGAVVGWGESTPFGPNYLPAYAGGVRAGLQVVGKAVLGLNPLHLNHLNVVMDKSLKGHPYVKSPIDVACWDILGKVSGLPVCELLVQYPREVPRIWRKAWRSIFERGIGNSS